MSNPQTPNDYLKSDEVGLVIAKGLAVTFVAKPENPIDYFARWLLNQSQVAKQNLIQEEKAVKLKEVKDDHDQVVRQKEKEQEAKDKETAEKQAIVDDFKHKVSTSKDLEYDLPDLVDHLKEETGSTAVYIG